MQSGVSFYKRSRGIFDTHGRERDVKMEQREIWRCWLWALESCGPKPRIAHNYWKLEEIKKNRFSLKSLWRDQSPAHTLISFGPQRQLMVTRSLSKCLIKRSNLNILSTLNDSVRISQGKQSSSQDSKRQIHLLLYCNRQWTTHCTSIIRLLTQ